VVVSLERGPRRVDDEGREHQEGDRGTAAPVVGSRGFSEALRVPTDHRQVCGHFAVGYREMTLVGEASGLAMPQAGLLHAWGYSNRCALATVAGYVSGGVRSTRG